VPHSKRIKPVRIFSKQAENVGQQKSPRLKIFDGRVERREPMLVPVYLARLDEPQARERTITEDVSAHGARVVTKRYWQRDEVPLLTPLIGEYPKYARVVYCDPQPEGGYCVGIKFSGPSFRWRV
jgi:hypothetical protein